MNTKYQGVIKGFQVYNAPRHYIHPTDPVMDLYDQAEKPLWPKKGDKIQFIGAKFAFHSNVLENGKKLTVGEVYTVADCEPFSSWCMVKVEEFPEDKLSLSFFKVL